MAIAQLRERIRFTRKQKLRRADGGYDTNVAPVSGDSVSPLVAEPSSLVLDFTADTWAADASHYGSAKVQENETFSKECFASVRPVQANESEQAGRLRSSTVYLIRVYRRTDIDAEHNILWLTNGNMPLNIREIRQPAGRVLMTEIVATSESVG